jgi:hypothetical protein
MEIQVSPYNKRARCRQTGILFIEKPALADIHNGQTIHHPAGRTSRHDLVDSGS